MKLKRTTCKSDYNGVLAIRFLDEVINELGLAHDEEFRNKAQQLSNELHDKYYPYPEGYAVEDLYFKSDLIEYEVEKRINEERAVKLLKAG